MWMVHLGHFLGTVIGTFFSAIGTTLLGLLIDGAFAASIAVATLYRKRRTEGWIAMLKHWRQEYKAGLRFAFWAAVIIYGPVALWSVGKAVYEDHRGLVARSQEQRIAIKVEAQKLQVQTDSDAKNITACQNQVSRMGGQNDTLNKQNHDQQDTINNCQAQALKLLAPEPFKITPVLLDPATPGVDLQSPRWLLITNKTVTPIDLIVQCSRRIISVSGQVLGGGGSIQLGGSARKLADNEYELSIASPAWSPITPLSATVSYSGGEFITCNFVER